MVLVFWIFVWYLIYTKKESKNETIVLIRELTTALSSRDIVDYRESAPVYEFEKKEEKKIIEDEIVDLDSVDPTQLLRSLKD